MALRRLLTFILLATLVACSESKEHEGPSIDTSRAKSIVGGVEVLEDNPEAPYVVMIYGEKASGESYVCTGTFISDSTILTAKHCIVDDPKSMSLFFGLKPLEVDSVEVPVISTLAFSAATADDKSANGREDIAIIKFDGGLPKGARIALLPTKDGMEDTANFWALGYGRTEGKADEETASKEVGTLREVYIAKSNLTLSANSFAVNQGDGHGVCYGDSGGPALAFAPGGKEMMVVGVASGVYNNSNDPDLDECRSASVYMRTSFYSTWLTENLNQIGTK